ncbi:Serine/threonine-protein kinase PEPKR2 [Cocos nucifera]|uniref:Serine/threonine-protein kinase PEPKR2 n=1 Tax=Cocos nucifera TaxID=13894 RepID=A0A8K0I3C9_COCNU|nr:Serine/threonine-protein kinase PEPKR2 [Cocos nucifera]
MTAPPSGRPLASSPGRGLKRKLGCIDPVTSIGRKKKLEYEYTLGRDIGQGRFGAVRLCRSRASGEEFACKTLPKNGEETVHREVEIMQHLSGHPGIVTLKAVFEDSESFHLLMELCSGGRLIDEMVREGRYSEQRAAVLIKELVSVIKYCHEMGVVHRDIKPENILLTTSGKMKLADFGLAVRIAGGAHVNLVVKPPMAGFLILQQLDLTSHRFSISYFPFMFRSNATNNFTFDVSRIMESCKEGQKLSGIAGSPAYVAPEVLLGHYSEKVDIWAAGVLLHALLVGTLPFRGESLEAIFEAIKKVELDFQSGIWESVSKLARDLLYRMLTRDVSTRLAADEVLSASIISASCSFMCFVSHLHDSDGDFVGVSGHPWILFYTECPSKALPIKSRVRNNVTKPRTEVQRIVVSNSPSVEGLSCKSEEQDACGFVDALAVAISRVRISEPKRSRICDPGSPIQQQCSSNMKTNLCTAF